MPKRVDLSLSEKVKLVSELELPGVTQVSVVKKYGVSTSQVSCPSKKEDLIRDFESGGNRSQKRKREGKEEDVIVGNALFLWFEQKLGLGAHLSGTLLKACDLARTKGTDYTPVYFK